MILYCQDRLGGSKRQTVKYMHFLRAVGENGELHVCWRLRSGERVDLHGPFVREVRILVTQNATESILRGDAELAFGSELYRYADALELRSINVSYSVGPIDVLVFWTQYTPCDLAEFRRTLAYVIDKCEISNIAFDGSSIPMDIPVVRDSIWSIGRAHNISERFTKSTAESPPDLSGG